jgi:hypothetical protein
MPVPQDTRPAHGAIRRDASKRGGKMEKYLRLANTFVLIGILVILVLIWTRLPQPQPQKFPTLEALTKVKGNTVEMKNILTQMPIVQVYGTLPVDVQNAELDVNVQNRELEVHVNN